MTTTRSGLCTDPPPSQTVDCNKLASGDPQVQTTPPPIAQQTFMIGEHFTPEGQHIGTTENPAPQVQDQNQEGSDFIIVRPGGVKRKNPLNPFGTKRVYPEYTTLDLLNMGNSHIREFVNETIPGAKCPSCRRKGKLSPIELPQHMQTGSRFWTCGSIAKPGGCRRIFAQSKVIGQCMQAGRKVTRELVFPHELAMRISSMTISLSEPEKMEVTPAVAAKPPPKKTQKVAGRNGPVRNPQEITPQPGMQQAGDSTKKEDSTPRMKSSIREGEKEKFGRMCDDAISIIKDPASSRDAVKAAAGVLEFLRPYMFGDNMGSPKKRIGITSGPIQPQVATYAATARKNMPMQPPKTRYPPAIERISRVKDLEERIEIGFRAITRQKKLPISRRVIKTNSIENPILRDQVAGAKFLYVKGIVRQPIRNIKKTFDQAGIDIKSIYDISFIGKTVCAILCKSEYHDVIASIVNSSRSGAKVLEDFDPLEPGVFRPELLQAESHKSPEEFLIRRAAYSAVMTNNMVVTTAFQSIIPEQYHQRYREEIAVIEMERGKRQRPRVRNV